MSRRHWRPLRWLLVLGAVLLLVGSACRPVTTKRSAAGVVIPAHLTEPRAQRDYLVAHYWDGLQEQPDRTPEELRLLTEDYCTFIAGLSPQAVRPSLRQGLDLLSPPSLREVLPIYREQLFRLGSPTYDEALYGEVLRWMATSERADSLMKTEAILELTRLKHNAPGTLAQDFRYHEQDTLSHRLREFSAPYTLLLLLPDSSRQLSAWARELKDRSRLGKLIVQKRLRPLVVYTGSGRPDSLARTLLPQGTTWAYDSAGLIAREHRYDLRQGATLYLLDGEKRVLLRNGTLGQTDQILAKE